MAKDLGIPKVSLEVQFRGYLRTSFFYQSFREGMKKTKAGAVVFWVRPTEAEAFVWE